MSITRVRFYVSSHPSRFIGFGRSEAEREMLVQRTARAMATGLQAEYPDAQIEWRVVSDEYPPATVIEGDG